jgi:dihydrofolate reductase
MRRESTTRPGAGRGLRPGRSRWTDGPSSKDVLLVGGVSIARQALAARLVEEIVLQVAPKLVGRGVRFFGAERGDLHCVGTIQGEGAVHLRYDVR